MEKSIDEQAADVILHTPIKFAFKNRGLTRLLGFRKLNLSITPLWPGTVVKISREKKKLKFNLEEHEKNPFKSAFENYEENSWTIARILAIAIINTKPEKRWLTNFLTAYLHLNLSEEDRKSLLMVVRSKFNISDFTISIVFLDGLGILSPKKTETSPTGTGETIAPGDSLAE